MKSIVISLIIFVLTHSLYSQNNNYTFGKGINFVAKDSTFSIAVGFRIQTLFSNYWTISGDDLGKIEENQSKFSIRRSRFKFEGFAYSPKLRYKFEVGLSNSDITHAGDPYFGKGGNMILDAYVNWNFYKGFSLQVGQYKLPGNRERVISSGNMQFVDRSILNSAFNLDRDIGVMFGHNGKIGAKMKTKLLASITQGKGRNVISGNYGGYEYTFRGELLPFGSFLDKGDYIEGAMTREAKPKLSVGATFDINDKAVRTRGNLGDFMVYKGVPFKSLYTAFIDVHFKYQGFSLLAEYALRYTNDRQVHLRDENDVHLATYVTGAALNVQCGYMLKSNIEFVARYSKFTPQNKVVGVNENQYMIGASKYIVGHRLKIQTDIGYFQKLGKDDGLGWRVQMELHL